MNILISLFPFSDEDVHQREADKIAAARAKQQEAHDAVAAALKVREEEAKQQRLEELRKVGDLPTSPYGWIQATEKESMLKYAINTLPRAPAKKESPGEIIDRFVASRPVVMFSKTSCPFCRKAKSVLATFRLSSEDYVYVELDERDDLPGEQIQQEFIKRYGTRSVPKVRIFPIFKEMICLGLHSGRAHRRRRRHGGPFPAGSPRGHRQGGHRRLPQEVAPGIVFILIINKHG